VRVLADLDSLDELTQGSTSVALELEECMIDGSYSFLCDITSHTGDEEEVVDPAFMGEIVLDDPYLLG